MTEPNVATTSESDSFVLVDSMENSEKPEPVTDSEENSQQVAAESFSLNANYFTPHMNGDASAFDPIDNTSENLDQDVNLQASSKANEDINPFEKDEPETNSELDLEPRQLSPKISTNSLLDGFESSDGSSPLAAPVNRQPIQTRARKGPHPSQTRKKENPLDGFAKTPVPPVLNEEEVDESVSLDLPGATSETDAEVSVTSSPRQDSCPAPLTGVQNSDTQTDLFISNSFRDIEAKIIISKPSLVRDPTPDNIFATPTATSQVDMSNPFQGFEASANSLVPDDGFSPMPSQIDHLEGFEDTFVGLTSEKKTEINLDASDLDPTNQKVREIASNQPEVIDTAENEAPEALVATMTSDNPFEGSPEVMTNDFADSSLSVQHSNPAEVTTDASNNPFDTKEPSPSKGSEQEFQTSAANPFQSPPDDGFSESTPTSADDANPFEVNSNEVTDSPTPNPFEATVVEKSNQNAETAELLPSHSTRGRLLDEIAYLSETNDTSKEDTADPIIQDGVDVFSGIEVPNTEQKSETVAETDSDPFSSLVGAMENESSNQPLILGDQIATSELTKQAAEVINDDDNFSSSSPKASEDSANASEKPAESVPPAKEIVVDALMGILDSMHTSDQPAEAIPEANEIAADDFGFDNFDKESPQTAVADDAFAEMTAEPESSTNANADPDATAGDFGIEDFVVSSEKAAEPLNSNVTVNTDDFGFGDFVNDTSEVVQTSVGGDSEKPVDPSHSKNEPDAVGGISEVPSEGNAADDFGFDDFTNDADQVLQTAAGDVMADTDPVDDFGFGDDKEKCAFDDFKESASETPVQNKSTNPEGPADDFGDFGFEDIQENASETPVQTSEDKNEEENPVKEEAESNTQFTDETDMTNTPKEMDLNQDTDAAAFEADDTDFGNFDDVGFGDSTPETTPKKQEMSTNDDDFEITPDQSLAKEEIQQESTEVIDDDFGDFGDDGFGDFPAEPSQSDTATGTEGAPAAKADDGFDDDFGDFGDFGDDTPVQPQTQTAGDDFGDFGDFGDDDFGFEESNQNATADDHFGDFEAFGEDETSFATESDFTESTLPETPIKEVKTEPHLPLELEELRQVITDKLQLELITTQGLEVPTIEYSRLDVVIPELEPKKWDGGALQKLWFQRLGFKVPPKRKKRKRKPQSQEESEIPKRPPKPSPMKQKQKIDDPFEVFNQPSTKSLVNNSTQENSTQSETQTQSNASTSNILDIFGFTTPPQEKAAPAGDNLLHQTLFGIGLSAPKAKSNEEKVSEIIGSLPDLSWVSRLFEASSMSQGSSVRRSGESTDI